MIHFSAHWGPFSVSLLLLTSCGPTDKRDIDHSVLWSEGSNQVTSGGYWFTYIDHLAWMENHPDLNPGKHTASQGATISPLTDMTHALPIVSDPDESSGHGDTIHVSGSTPAAPTWTDVTTTGNWFDTSPFKVTSFVTFQEAAQWTRASCPQIEFALAPAFWGREGDVGTCSA